MHDRKDPLSVVLLFLRKRSKIIEILAAQEIVLALDNRVFVQHLTEVVLVSAICLLLNSICDIEMDILYL